MSGRAIAQRVGRLERATAGRACRSCAGYGIVTSVRAHLEPVPEKPEACPGCGKSMLIVVRRVERVERDLNLAPQVRYC